MCCTVSAELHLNGVAFMLCKLSIMLHRLLPEQAETEILP